MLMYGKEARNRKQEIDRQHQTIPNQRNQRPKDKHCGKIQKFRFFHNVDDYETSHSLHLSYGVQSIFPFSTFFSKIDVL